MAISDWLKGYMDSFGTAELMDKVGETATYTTVDQVTTKSLHVIFNEFVGAIDEKGRGLFSISSDATLGIVLPRRGDSFLLNSVRWYVVDFRTDHAGLHELRCDLAQADV
jgi:hypothetical protein